MKEDGRQGQAVWSVAAPGGPDSVIRRPNGNTLIAWGDMKPGGPRVFETDPAGQTVWEVKNDDLPGIKLAFMSGLQRLPNGHTLMSNWLGHGRFGTAPHLIEVSPDKQVRWTFADHQTMKTISSVQRLDVPGDVAKGEILH